MIIGTLAGTPSEVEFHPKCEISPPTDSSSRIRSCSAQPWIIIPLLILLTHSCQAALVAEKLPSPKQPSHGLHIVWCSLQHTKGTTTSAMEDYYWNSKPVSNVSSPWTKRVVCNQVLFLRRSCSSGSCSFMVAVKSFEDTSSEVIANWFSHPSGNPNSSAGNLGVWKLMLRPNCWSRWWFSGAEGHCGVLL